MEQDKELLPCPFCGSTNLGNATLDHAPDMMNVYCRNCCVEGPAERGWGESITAWNKRATPAPVAAPAALTDKQREKVRDAIAEAIGGSAYDCLRVWSAWGVGTMSQDDFALVVEDESRLAEITDAAIGAMPEPQWSLSDDQMDHVMRLTANFGRSYGYVGDREPGSRELVRKRMGEILAAQPAAPAPKCATCKGTRMVDDGEITGSGGIEFENGPIQCVKDCPDCAQPSAPAPADRQVCEHDWIENKGYPLSDTAAEVCSKCWTGRDEPTLSRRAESVARTLLADRQGVALSEAARRLMLAVNDVDQGRAIHNERHPDRRIDGAVWKELRNASAAMRDTLLARASSSRAEVERIVSRALDHCYGQSHVSDDMIQRTTDAVLAAAEAPNGDQQ